MNYLVAKDFDVGWQYQQAKNLRKIIENRDDFASKYIISQFTDFEKRFNIDTCDSFGLKVWSIILGVSKKISNNFLPFGFEGGLNFDNGTFSDGGDADDEYLRLMLKLKYRKITMPSNFSTLEESLKMIDDGIMLQDNGDMTITIFSYNGINDKKLLLISKEFLSIPNSVLVITNFNMANKFYLDWFSFDQTTLT